MKAAKISPALFSLLLFLFLCSNSKIQASTYTPVMVEVDSLPFTAEVLECNVVLRWQTSQQQQYSRFEVERSRDGQQFETVMLVTANAKPQHYERLHTTDWSSAWYRLKMVDFKGKHHFSELVPVQTDCKKEGITIVYPNPVEASTSTINVKVSSQQGSGMVFIVDQEGKVERRMPLDLEEGINLIRMDIADLASGDYFIGLERNGPARFKFVKKEAGQ
ncbi:MAG: T9SS type A sorting domain-containing protein [Bacteroidota bacterium]